MFTWEQRMDMIVIHAWETWTNNGNGLDDDMRTQTTRSVQDAATNAYLPNMTNKEWLAATLKRLGV